VLRWLVAGRHSMRRLLATASLTLALFSATVPSISQFGARVEGRADAQAPERVSLGVMRRDGVIVPFATFDGDEWSMPWPGSVQNMELPITLDAVPSKWWGSAMPTAWTLWPATGQPAVKVAPIAPLAILIGREKRVGLRTDFVSDQPAASFFELPFPKEGLVVAGNTEIRPITRVSRMTPAWKTLTASIQEDIEEAERKEIARLKSNTKWVHPLVAAERSRVVAELEAWYTTGLEQPGFAISYLEAVKKYPPGVDDLGCGLETFVSGWIHINTRQEKPKTELTARVTYCDRKGVSYMLPLGLLKVRNRTHWVFQASSWEREWYAVAEATPGRIRFVAEYYAGGRPSPF
jgi:hypothetical protein